MSINIASIIMSDDDSKALDQNDDGNANDETPESDQGKVITIIKACNYQVYKCTYFFIMI